MKNSLKEIFNNNYSGLVNYSFAIIKDRNTAEDIVQSVFIQLWENNKILQLQKPETYLLKCVKYKSLDFVKSPLRKKEILSDTLPEKWETEKTGFKEEDIVPMLHFFCAKLPPKMQQVFLMSRQKGMTYKEIANELQISIKTVENHMGAALKKMRVLLQKHHYLPALILFLN